MKKLFLILLIFVSIKLGAQDSIQRIYLFLNIGQSIPFGDYSATSITSTPVEIGKKSNFPSSFSFGLDYYLRKINWIGFTLGVSKNRFNLDESSFLSLHSEDLQNTDLFLKEHNFARIYFGLTSLFAFRNLSIEPRASLGLTSYNFEFADFYQKNSEGAIYRTINYKFENSISVSYNLGINASYYLFDIYRKKVGIQLFSEISYQKPKVEYQKIESNKDEETLKISNEDFRQNILFIYYGIGIIMKL